MESTSETECGNSPESPILSAALNLRPQQRLPRKRLPQSENEHTQIAE